MISDLSNFESENQDDEVDAEPKCEPASQVIDELFESIWQLISMSETTIVHVTDVVSHQGSEVGNSRSRPKVFPCPTCGKLFSQFPSARKHCVRKQGTFSVTCHVCGKVVKEKKNMKRHLEIHKRKPSSVSVQSKEVRTCEGCGKVFTTRQRLDYHMVSKHGVHQSSRPETTHVYECQHCSFSHVKQSVLKTHISKAHSKCDKVNCDQCDYFCFSKSGLFKHKATVHRSEANVGKEVIGEGLEEGSLPSQSVVRGPINLVPIGPGHPQVMLQAPTPVLSLPGHQAGRALSLPGHQAGNLLSLLGHVRPQQGGPRSQPLYASQNQIHPNLLSSPALPVARKTQPHHSVTSVQSHVSDISVSFCDIDDSFPFLSQNISNNNFVFGPGSIEISSDGKELLNL